MTDIRYIIMHMTLLRCITIRQCYNRYTAINFRNAKLFVESRN